MSPPYEAPGSRATPAILALYVLIGAWALTIGADVRRIVVAHRYGRDGLDDSLQSADQLVRATTLLAVLVLVVAAALVARWALVARRNNAALGATAAGGAPRGSAATVGASAGGPAAAGRRPRVFDSRRLRVCAALVVLAAAALLATTLAFGEAADIADRERIDAFKAAASLLAAVATGATIALVASVTREQDAAALAAGIPRATRGATPEESRSAGGTRVLSEEQARREQTRR